MAMTVSCPSCNKALRIGEENQGKKMRCPSCQQIFKAPMLSDAQEEFPASSPFSDLDAPEPRRPRRDEDDYDDRPSRRRDEPEDDRPSRRRDEFADDRPSRRRDRDEDDRPSRRVAREDDYDDRPRRRRDYEDDDEDYRRPPPSGTGTGPNVMAILSCVLCIFPLIGFILGLVAYFMANSALNSFPRGSEYREERRKLETSKTVAIVGMCLSGGLFLLCCGVNVLGNMR